MLAQEHESYFWQQVIGDWAALTVFVQTDGYLDWTDRKEAVQCRSWSVLGVWPPQGAQQGSGEPFDSSNSRIRIYIK